jgi:hypothetical protein
MPKAVVDRVNYIGRDQPIQPVFLDRADNPIGDGDANYEEDPANPTEQSNSTGATPLGQFTGRMSTRRGVSKSLSRMCS